jgi:hypothetical protein
MVTPSVSSSTTTAPILSGNFAHTTAALDSGTYPTHVFSPSI